MRRSLTAVELSARIGGHPSSIANLLQEEVAAGHVEYVEDRWRLTPEFEAEVGPALRGLLRPKMEMA